MISRIEGDWEIYVFFVVIYGISYIKAEYVEQIRGLMKKETKEEFEKNKKSSDEFIKTFARHYELQQIENSLFSECEAMDDLLNL